MDARSDQAAYAARALAAFRDMQGRFHAGSGRYRRDGRLRVPRLHAHLWPFSRALFATLDVAGIHADLTPGFDARSEIADRLEGLERYWDGEAYASDVVASRLPGGDRYYDDNAWVGLALVQLERLGQAARSLGRAREDFTAGATTLARAGEILAFVSSGWDRRDDVAHPGGVFWVEQGRGVGRRNHDRNTVSNAPNAELGLQLGELAGSDTAGARAMYEWVNGALDSGGDGGGPFWDKWRGDGTLDETAWSYNQGSMVGANVVLHRLDGGPYLARAEEVSRRALRLPYADQPPAFGAILFRNLLKLHAASGDAALRDEIDRALRTYGDRLSGEQRARTGTLLDASAAVQLLALLAWDERDYARLA